MIHIERFQWDERNEEHLWRRHSVTPEEAEEVFYTDPYWEDMEPYWEDMEDDEVIVSFVPRKHLIVMPLNEDLLRDVRKLALEKGLSSVQLLQKWIVDGLHQESDVT